MLTTLIIIHVIIVLMAISATILLCIVDFRSRYKQDNTATILIDDNDLFYFLIGIMTFCQIPMVNILWSVLMIDSVLMVMHNKHMSDYISDAVDKFNQRLEKFYQIIRDTIGKA